MRRTQSLFLLIALAVTGCQKASKTDKMTKGPEADTLTATGTGSGPGTSPGTGGMPVGEPPAPGPGKDIDSKDLLGRADVASTVDVKHVLIAWKDLAPIYRGRMDKRAEGRSNDDAAKLAQDLLAKMKANPDSIDALVKEHSEDPGSLGGEAYTVTGDSPFVPEFKNLALRLKEKEAGIVKTQFGYHVMMRVLPAPPDPLESAEIMARPAGTGSLLVQHVLIGWKDVPAGRQGQLDPRAAARSKADADKLAKEVLDKVRAGGDMAALMKEFSEDPGSKDNARTYEVSPSAGLVEPFKQLSLRLNMGEAGMVKTTFGWHVIKRVPPPPPDKLESADILARKAVTEKAKVKHILLGWKDLSAGDPRAAKRTRAELDALVKKTVAALKKGGKIDPLMKELSEDPGSAEAGTSYDVTPDAGLVPPFKDLSLRLEVGEVGVVKTDFGFHIIQRVE